jgi:uncharacterized protein Yka (UPF0111/DUF47 family)
MATVTDEYGDDVLDATVAYLADVRDCVSLLPTALEHYGTAEFAPTVDRLCERESDCDASLRELRRLLGDVAPPNYTEVYLRTGEVMRLYAAVDDVPNAAERFVRQLDVIDPHLSPSVRTEFGAMAAATVEATDLLAAVTEDCVADLVSEDEADDYTTDIERIAALESDCDGHKAAVVETAFESNATADALLVRDLAASLDAAVDAAEDAADHLVFMQGASV